MIGQKIGNYEVTTEIGRGGMGAVYEARHAMLDKKVAVKVLLPQYSSNEEIVQRFFNEAKASTCIDHPGIVELYDFGHMPDGSAYIVMEYLQGEGLDTRIRRRGKMQYPEAVRLARRIAGILAAAHSRGIVHRDLKPENIFLVPDPGVAEGERPKVLDFGIAKLGGEGSSGSGSVQTRTGVVIGSPLYMAPEQCKGAGGVDHRADVYSLACILFELLSGRPPFQGDGAGEIIAAHIHLAHPDVRTVEPSVPEGVAEFLNLALAKNPNDRFSSMKAFSDALRGYSGSGGRAETNSPVAPEGSFDNVTPIPTPIPARVAAGAFDGTISAVGQTASAPVPPRIATEPPVASAAPLRMCHRCRAHRAHRFRPP